MIPELGIIEGYFGRCWSWDDRAAVIRILAPAGYRFFHYAPKLDRKLRRDWAIPYNATELDALRSFASDCRGNAVRFGVGLTPYGAHLDFSAETRAQLKAKLLQLATIGLDDLAILFDDMRGDLPDLAQRQAEIVDVAFQAVPDARGFMCPSYYSDDPVLDRVFGARPENYLHDLGRMIDPAIAIYWTGEEVCAPEISPGHIADVAQLLGRKPALWDNYPVNDGPRMSQYLHLRGFTGRPAGLAPQISHHAINPASQPILGCIPALTLPDSYRLGDDYRYAAAFLHAAKHVVGPELAAMLQADLLTLHESGLDRMSEERKTKLIAKYAALDHPAAREVVDWLASGYAITGEMLETQ
jgi:hyaluronoglucosaminidase